MSEEVSKKVQAGAGVTVIGGLLALITQLSEVQGDLGGLQSDVTEVGAKQAKIVEDVSSLKGEIRELRHKLDIELLNFRNWMQAIEANTDDRIRWTDVDAAFQFLQADNPEINVRGVAPRRRRDSGD